MAESSVAPSQFAPPPTDGRCGVPCRLGGVNNGLRWYVRISSSASRWVSGVGSFASSSEIPWSAHGAGRVGNGRVGYGTSAGTSVSAATQCSSIGQAGSPVTRSKTDVTPCFETSATASIVRPSTRSVISFGADVKSGSCT